MTRRNQYLMRGWILISAITYPIGVYRERRIFLPILLVILVSIALVMVTLAIAIGWAGRGKKGDITDSREAKDSHVGIRRSISVRTLHVQVGVGS